MKQIVTKFYFEGLRYSYETNSFALLREKIVYFGLDSIFFSPEVGKKIGAYFTEVNLA